MQVNHTTQQEQAKMRYEPPVLRKHDKLVDIVNPHIEANVGPDRPAIQPPVMPKDR